MWHHTHMNDDEFSWQVLSVTQLFPETQSDAALRWLAAVWTEVIQLWLQEKEKWVKCIILL